MITPNGSVVQLRKCTSTSILVFCRHGIKFSLFNYLNLDGATTVYRSQIRSHKVNKSRFQCSLDVVLAAWPFGVGFKMGTKGLVITM